MNQASQNYQEDEIDLRELFRLFIKRKWLFIGSVIVVIITGFLYVFFQPPQYIASYQFSITEDYNNDKLYSYYPNKSSELNFISVENVPPLFKTSSIFSSLNGVEGIESYHGWLISNDIKLSLNDNTNIFDITVSSTDKDLAGKIVLTLVNSFDDFIEETSKNVIDDIIEGINYDIELLEKENVDFENQVNEYEEEIVELYKNFTNYIIEFNVELAEQIEDRKVNSNYSFYNLIVPPNTIQHEITKIEKEVEFYRQEIFNNKMIIGELQNLKSELYRDEKIITDRIDVLTEKPIYTSESNRRRNLAMVVILSLIVGVCVVFITSFIQSIKKHKNNLGANKKD